MTSKTARRRRKKAAKISIPGQTATPQHRAGAKTHEDPRKTALEARCRVSGMPTTTQALDAARAPHWGCDVGRCISEAASHDQGRLWDTWCRMTASRRNWLQRSIGLTGDPANSNMPHLPEPMETDPSATVDTRSQEERDRDARRAYDYWSGLVEDVQWMVGRMHLRLAVSGMGGPWWQEGRPTSKGKALVRALREVADMDSGASKRC